MWLSPVGARTATESTRGEAQPLNTASMVAAHPLNRACDQRITDPQPWTVPAVSCHLLCHGAFNCLEPLAETGQFWSIPDH